MRWRWIITLTLTAILVFVLLAYAGIGLPLGLSEDAARYNFVVRGTSLAVLVAITMIAIRHSGRDVWGSDSNWHIVDFVYVLPLAAATGGIPKLLVPEPIMLLGFAVAVLTCALVSWRWHPGAQQPGGVE